MPQFDNYEVCIHVDGKKIPEYGMQHSTKEGLTEITCWIPSEVGKSFQISYKDSVRAFDTTLCTSVDGNECPSGPILCSRKTGPHRPDSVTQKGFSTSNNSYRPFIFSKCQLTDEDGFVSSSPEPGQLTVSIDRIEVGERKKDKKDYKPLPEPKVHEQSKKGLVHGIKLGPESYRKRHVRSSKFIQHLVTFKFLYRPLNVLVADGIVPLSTPINAEEARIQALREELFILESRQDQNKRKRDDFTSTPQRVKKERVKKERVKKERSIALDNNIIDLT